MSTLTVGVSRIGADRPRGRARRKEGWIRVWWWNGNGNCTGNYLVTVTNNFVIVAEVSSREEISTLVVLGRSVVLECRFLVMVFDD